MVVCVRIKCSDGSKPYLLSMNVTVIKYFILMNTSVQYLHLFFNLQMINSTKNIRVTRAISVSAFGKRLDRQFKIDFSLKRSKSSQSTQQKQQLPKITSQKHALMNPKKNDDMKHKIKKQIDQLRMSSNKKKLVIKSKKIEPQTQRESSKAENTQIRNDQVCISINSWKQIKHKVPSSGYLYISHPHQLQKPQRKITLSKDWVLITQPQNQSILSINQYTQTLRKLQLLKKIELYRKFMIIKSFRKWKMITQYNQLNMNKNIIDTQIHKIYREVYNQLVNYLERIRLKKFIGCSKTHSVILQEYHEYLYSCSQQLIQQIHNHIFPACIEIIFNPIRQLALRLRYDQLNNAKDFHRQPEDIYKNKDFCNRQEKNQKKILRIVPRGKQKPFQLVKSIEFRQSFMQYFGVFKKCLYIFNEAYVEWVRGCLLQLISKIEGSLMIWQREKIKFAAIIGYIVSHKCQKYQFYNSDVTQKQIGLIAYKCQIHQDKSIHFQVNQEYLTGLFTQYIQFLLKNLTFQKMSQCYARTHRSQSATLLELLEEIIKTNDTYNCQQILKCLGQQHEFKIRLKHAIAINYAQVHQVIDFYNVLINDFFTNKEQLQNPSQINSYLESFKIKFLYLPTMVDVGLFALDFKDVHQYLNFQVTSMQTNLYINVPTHFRELYNKVLQIMNSSYQGIRNSMWTVDELLSSYKFYEVYQEYRIHDSHEDIKRCKDYLQVISSKCPQHYDQCFLMFVHIKELRDKLEIKTQIFTQRLASRLKSFYRDIQNLKELIWNNLYSEQSSAISICKESVSIPERLVKLQQCNDRLRQTKDKMDKLQVIARLELEYFIEQDLTINTHSYHKVSHDVLMLINFITKFMDFQGTVFQLFPKFIAEYRCQQLLNLVRMNVAEIKQVYLLLIIYQTTLKQLLEKYDTWRQYLQTVDQIAFLTNEQMKNIIILKELNLNSKNPLTFEDCFNFNIRSVYEQIHQIKERKQRVSELYIIFSDIQALQTISPFQIQRYRSRQSKSNRTINTLRSVKMLDEGKNDVIKYKFQNFQNVYRSLQQFQNELKCFASSSYLSDYNYEISLKIGRVQNAVKLLEQVSSTHDQYNKVMEIEIYDYTLADNQQQNKWVVTQQIISFFHSYRNQRQQIRQSWIKFVNGLSKKSLAQHLLTYEDVHHLIKVLVCKIRALRQCVDVMIRKKRQQVLLLNLVDSSTVLLVLYNPSYYFELFYSIRQVAKINHEIHLTTSFDQILILSKGQDEKDFAMQINSIELMISHQLRKLLVTHNHQHPIDNLLNYMSLQLPLQVIYVLDQLYFTEKYIKNQKPSLQILRNLQGEIRLICRNGLRQQINCSHLNYNLGLFQQLLASRIELRTRIDHNTSSQIWYKNVLIFQLYENMLTLRNFNTEVISSFKLANPTSLALAFPFCEKALVKICNSMRFQESIVVDQTQMVACIAARTMSIFYQVKLNPSNIENVLFACQHLYPLFVVGFLNSLQEDLVFVFEQLNKIEKINSIYTNISKDRRLIPSIFIHCQNSTNIELSETLKLRFRVVTAVNPCPQVMLSMKMLNHDFLIEKGMFLNLVFLLKSYIILLRQQEHYYISFHDLGLICNNIMRKLSFQSGQNHDSFLFNLLKDYFQAINYPLQKFLNHFVINKNRTDFQRSSIYQLAQNIVLNTIKEIPIKENSAVITQLKQYKSMKISFIKYSQNLTNQKYDPLLIEKLQNLFELSFNLQNRPIAVIGACHSGKDLLFTLFSQFLEQTLGQARMSWCKCNLQIFNAALGIQITQNQAIVEHYIKDYDQKDISWIVFEGFALEQNMSLFQYIFSRMDEELRINNILLDNSALSFCELFHCRQFYLQKTHSLHNKYVGFKLQNLQGISPSSVYSISKVYLPSNTISLQGLYQMKISQFLKKLIDRNEEIYAKVCEIFNQLSKYLLGMLEEVLVKKIKNLEWMITITQKNALQHILQFFFSFFYHEGKQKLQFLFLDNAYLQLYKLITYCFSATLQNFVQRTSIVLLQKITKNYYEVVSKQINNDKFLMKICNFNTKQICYFTEQEASKIEESGRYFYHNFTVQTIQMKNMYKKYFKQLIETQTPILVFGSKQSGKTEMIKLFINKYCNSNIILKGSDEESSFKQLSNKLAGGGGSSKASSQTTLKKLDYCIYIQDVSCNKELSKIQKYLLYIIQNGLFIEQMQLRTAPLITGIIERRNLSQQLKNKLWKCFFISFQTSKQQFDSIFSNFVCNKVQVNLKIKGKKTVTVNMFQKLVQKYLKIVHYCHDNFKRGHKSWTYQFGIVTFKSIIENYIDRYNYDNFYFQEFSSRMSYQIISKLLDRLQEQRQIDKIYDRIALLFDGGELKEIQQRNTRQNVLLNSNLDQAALNNARIKNVIITEPIRRFVPKLAITLLNTNCVLINKFNVPYNRSIASAAIQILKIPYHQLIYCQKQTKFLAQIQRANGGVLKKNSTSYYYLSVEEIMVNPQIIYYIKNYLSKQQKMQANDSYHHQCKFILEYSTQNHTLIAHFLRAKIISFSHILHYNERGDINQVTNMLVQENGKIRSHTSINNDMQNLTKIALRIVDELKSFDPPKQLANYIFQHINISYYILFLTNTYYQLLKNIETKKNALQLSLSQLNYMFRQYKQRKKLHKQLQNQQSWLLSAIGSAKDTHRRKTLEYNSIKNQNMKEAIMKNQQEIIKLQKEKEHLISSEKIWTNIYKTNHAAISRTQFAEIKYMFLANYSIQRQFFQAIAFVLGESTDLYSLKKCFSDTNIMARIKQIKISELPEAKLRELQNRIDSISKKDRLNCGRNIVDWMKVGCKLGIYKMQREDSLKSYQSKIKKFEEQNKQIRQKNKMDQMQKQLFELQKSISQKTSDLNKIHLKISSISSELEQVKKQFEDLIQFETFCLQQLQILQQHSKQLLKFCMNESLQFAFTEQLTGDYRRKFRELVNTKLRKLFGGLVSKQQSNYFNLLRQVLQIERQSWVIKPKDYLSSSKKILIKQINNFILQHNLTLMVIDKRSVITQDTVKNNHLLLRMHNLHQAYKNLQQNLEKYCFIIIQINCWNFSLQFSSNQHESYGKFKIFKYKNIRVSIPGHIPLILIAKDHGPKQLMRNFKIIDLTYNVDDYYQIVWNTIIKKRGIQKQDGYIKLARTNKKFMQIVYFLCRKTQSINLKSKQLIKTLTNMIQIFNYQRSQSRHAALRTIQQEQSQQDIKLCRILSKIIELMITHFPSKEHTSFFFRDLLNTSFDYVQMQGAKDIESIINLVIQLLTQGFKDRFPFLHLYYTRIYSVQQNIATPMESLNLTALPDLRQLTADSLRDVDHDPTNFFKYLPFKNMELQKTYVRLSRVYVQHQSELARLIENQKTLSLFNKLILKRALSPRFFQIQIGHILREFEDKITLKNKMFLRRYVVKQRLFCVCDAGFWVSKLKFTDQFKLVQLSDLAKTSINNVRKQTWAVFDDMEDNEARVKMLLKLVSIKSQEVNIILFSKEYLSEDIREQFKFLPFQHLLNIFEIKQLTKVGRSKYSHIFNKVIYFKTELLRRKPFNQRISLSFLFEKIRQQIMNRQDYSPQQITLHLEWDFFLWDLSFQKKHLTLNYILSALQVNPELINEFVADDKLQDRINTVIYQSRCVHFDEVDVCRLATQLKDSFGQLNLKKQYCKETDVFYLEYQYKKQNLMKEVEVIKRIAQISQGRIESTAQIVVELEMLLKKFHYRTFSDMLIKLISWRSQQHQSQSIFNIGNIKSQFNFYLLFQNSVYIYYQIPSKDVANEENATQTNDQITLPLEIPIVKSSIEKDTTNKRKSIKKTGSSKSMQKRNSSALSLNKIINNGRRISIGNPLMFLQSIRKSNNQIKEEYFKNSLFIIQNRVVGLKKLGIKEQKNLGMASMRILDLPNNFSIRIVELNQVLPNSKKQSRFKIMSQKSESSQKS